VWHFIGPIQSNKTRAIAENFSWVHSIDRLKIAERLSAQRPRGLPPLQVCIEINVSGEASKGGVAPVELSALAEAVAKLPGLQLRGLMVIPAPTPDSEAQRAAFRQVREQIDALRARGYVLDTLSMGMSGDLEAAILEGSTIVRIGTALFGERTKQHKVSFIGGGNMARPSSGPDRQRTQPTDIKVVGINADARAACLRASAW
jgi:pyridoxal phosphate enzyme (YggS family)